MSELNNIIVWAGTISILVSFIFALSICNPKDTRSYMQYFFVYPLIGILISVNSILTSFFPLYKRTVNFPLQNFLLLVDLIFWVMFFSDFFRNKSDKTKLKITFFITLGFALFSYFYSPLDKPNLHTISLFNICKTLFCIYFYYDLFKKPPNQKIKSEPSFWIVTGLFFYSCLSMPFYALHDYLRVKFPLVISASLFAMSNILIIIMHFFFLKAYLCTARLLKG